VYKEVNVIKHHELGNAFYLFFYLFKEDARGGERTRVLSISFIFSFSPLYR
jgi:hypothetical protein